MQPHFLHVCACGGRQPIRATQNARGRPAVRRSGGWSWKEKVPLLDLLRMYTVYRGSNYGRVSYSLRTVLLPNWRRSTTLHRPSERAFAAVLVVLLTGAVALLLYTCVR